MKRKYVLTDGRVIENECDEESHQWSEYTPWKVSDENPKLFFRSKKCPVCKVTRIETGSERDDGSIEELEKE